MAIERARREGMRWQIISMLHKARPYTSSETFVRQVLDGIYPGVTALEVRQQLDYLLDRKMLQLNKQPYGEWFADLTRLGVDIAEYTIDCQPGIARPVKYWSDGNGTAQ